MLAQREYCSPSNENKNDRIILVVEDDDAIGSLLVEVLSEETPYQTVLVTDGWQALQIVRQMKPCLLITDYRLPRMNGIEVYDRLCTTREMENTPAILMSAYPPPEEEVQRHKLVSLNKPFELDELLEKVEHLLNDYQDLQAAD